MHCFAAVCSQDPHVRDEDSEDFVEHEDANAGTMYLSLMHTWIASMPSQEVLLGGFWESGDLGRLIYSAPILGWYPRFIVITG